MSKRADAVIAFGTRVEGEGFGLPDPSLPWGQDAVIDAGALANPSTTVVLETGNPVSMSWREKVSGIDTPSIDDLIAGSAVAAPRLTRRSTVWRYDPSRGPTFVCTFVPTVR